MGAPGGSVTGGAWTAAARAPFDGVSTARAPFAGVSDLLPPAAVAGGPTRSSRPGFWPEPAGGAKNRIPSKVIAAPRRTRRIDPVHRLRATRRRIAARPAGGGPLAQSW